MRRLAWLTDIHLNFVAPGHIDALCRSIREAEADAILLTGDVAEAPDVVAHLEGLDARLGRPLYFVLGNHHFYRGSIAAARAAMARLCARSPTLRWLPRSGVVELAPGAGLLGHDGWADGRLGEYAGSDVFLNDYVLIEVLAGLDAGSRLGRLHDLGDEAAAHFRAVLPEALGRFRRLIVLIHVPPSREACWHEGRVSGEAWLAHFACRAVGEALVEAMSAHRDCEMTVLCGHTHSAGEGHERASVRDGIRGTDNPCPTEPPTPRPGFNPA